MFVRSTKAYYRDPWIKISGMLGVTMEQVKRVTQSRNKFAELVQKCTILSP